MDGSVEDDSRLGTLSSTSPDVDTSQGPTLERVSKGEDLRSARIGSLQVGEELNMIGVRVVGGKPGLARSFETVSLVFILL